MPRSKTRKDLHECGVAVHDVAHTIRYDEKQGF